MNNFLRIYFQSQMMKKLLSKIFNIIKVDKDCFFVLTANHASLISYHSRNFCRERFFKRDKFPWKPQWSILWHLFTDKSLIILEMQFYWIFITDKSLIFAFFCKRMKHPTTFSMPFLRSVFSKRYELLANWTEKFF